MTHPYFAMYPEKFEANAGWLSLAEDGAYNRLLRLCWMTPGCSIPNDPKWIKRRMRINDNDYSSIVSGVIEEFFQVKGGRLHNPKLTKEFQRSSEKIKNAKKNGKKGGRPPKLPKNNKKSETKSFSNRNPDESYREEETETDIPSSLLSAGDDWRDVRELCLSIAKPVLNAEAMAWMPIEPILNLLNDAAHPADLEADVLPALRQVASRGSPSNMRNFKYFVPIIIENRDKRLAGNPTPKDIENGKRNQPSNRITEIGNARRDEWREILEEYPNEGVAKAV